jgi:hypothetical protein
VVEFLWPGSLRAVSAIALVALLLLLLAMTMVAPRER